MPEANGNGQPGEGHRLRSLTLVPRAAARSATKDFKSDQEVRWCPGCGDYAILAAFQAFLPELEVPRENIAVISGIGCSSRLPYYVNSYGMHSIHGRAPAIATGLAASRPAGSAPSPIISRKRLRIPSPPRRESSKYRSPPRSTIGLPS